MPRLPRVDFPSIEELLGMRSGYVMDRSNRLDTYCMKRFMHLLHERGLDCSREEALHSRVGKLVKHLNADGGLRPITAQILRNAVGVLQAFNDVRNNASFAHDNEIVDADAARLIFDSILATLRFVDRLSPPPTPS